MASNPVELPIASEARRQAEAAASRPLTLATSVIGPILRAISVGDTSVVVDVTSDAEMTKKALESRGYVCKWVQTGMNETGLRVSWGD